MIITAPLPDRLSVSRHSEKLSTPFTTTELRILARVADTLIPGDETNLAGSAVGDFEGLVTKAAAILDGKHNTLPGILDTLKDVPEDDLWTFLEKLNADRPADFYILSTVIAAAYIYSPEMGEVLGYPRPHQNPPGLFEIADELSSGILDPVIERGPIYVPAATG